VPDSRAPDPAHLLNAFSDPARFRQFQRLVESCPPDEPPCLRILLSERLAASSSLAVLAGSFNPLTNAHVALAEAGERQLLAPTLFALSTHTVDKEQPEGALLADRLLVLELHARTTTNRAVAVLNRGLYVEQARLLRTAFPKVRRLTFLVGIDKIVQLFDSRYYDDRQAALGELFELASFAVAPRADAGAADLVELLRRPENAAFAACVRPLDLDPGLAATSSSTIRARLRQGGQSLPPGLAPESASFVAATGCYAPPIIGPDGRAVDPYAERRALLAH
jgi:nicotinamide-nucleotide adenylyltransferase